MFGIVPTEESCDECMDGILLMQDIDIPGLDLKLLATLEALLRLRSVSDAALELGVSQPTLSHRLARLREVFADPLLVRGSHQTLLTPAAERLREPLAGVLRHVEGLLATGPFDPSRASSRLAIACTDYVLRLVMPRFLQRVRARAPGIDVVLATWGQKCFEDLATGELDLGMGVVRREMPGIHRRKLFDDEFVCVAAAKNRAAHAGMSAERFAALPHVRIAVTGVGEGVVDAALRERGLARRIVVQLRHFWLAPELVASTDLVAALPRRVAAGFKRDRRLQVFPVPVPVPPFGIHLLWHERHQTDPAHRWIRELLCESATDTDGGPHPR